MGCSHPELHTLAVSPTLLACVQGARIRHRLRQPACKGLCSEIQEMEQTVFALGDAQTVADAGLQRQLKQNLRVRR